MQLNTIPGRALWCFVACFVLLGFSDPDEPATDLEKLGLKGKVKSVMETRMSNAAGGKEKAEGGVTYKKLSKFNPEGFETETIIYNNNGKSSRLKYLFDTASYAVGLHEYTDDGTLWLTVSYKRDEEGNKLEAIFSWPEKAAYDEIREKSEQLYEVLDRSPWDYVVYENDYRGFHLEERYYHASGRLLFKFTYRYDIHGNKMEMIYFNSKGRTSWETKYKYNRDNQMVRSIIFKSNRVAATSEYAYQFDAQGNWVSRMEKRTVNYNILTQDLVEGSFMTERVIEYYND